MKINQHRTKASKTNKKEDLTLKIVVHHQEHLKAEILSYTKELYGENIWISQDTGKKQQTIKRVHGRISGYH